MTDTTIAKEIYRQLGSFRFQMMTGAKNLVASEDALTFQLPRNASKASYIKIRLNGSDTYDITFFNIRKLEIKNLKVLNDIYVENLISVLETETQLYFHL